MPTPNENAPKTHEINSLPPEPGSQPLLERYIDTLEYGYIWVCILKPPGPPFGPRRINLADIYLAIDLSRFIDISLLGTPSHTPGDTSTNARIVRPVFGDDVRKLLWIPWS
jgi:hypothetical protein